MSDTVLARHVSLGTLEYDKALQLQQARAAALIQMEDEDQTVYTVEHPPTITIGRNGSTDNIVASPDYLQAEGFGVFDVDRGGDVTYHGPGQLVVYPILHLSPWNNDVPRYVRMLEEVVIRALAKVGIVATRDAEHPGVWVGNEKICAVGCRVRRRKVREFVTSHGIALNVDTNLAHFSTIVPCGIHDKGVTSIQALRPLDLPSREPFREWERRIMEQFSTVFGLRFESVSQGELREWKAQVTVPQPMSSREIH